MPSVSFVPSGSPAPIVYWKRRTACKAAAREVASVSDPAEINFSPPASFRRNNRGGLPELRLADWFAANSPPVVGPPTLNRVAMRQFSDQLGVAALDQRVIRLALAPVEGHFQRGGRALDFVIHFHPHRVKAARVGTGGGAIEQILEQHERVPLGSSRPFRNESHPRGRRCPSASNWWSTSSAIERVEKSMCDLGARL